METKLTILLIEDSPDFAALVQRWLSPQGEEDQYIVNWADTLDAGLRRLAVGGVDVVLLDLGLPDSNGQRTFEAVRNTSDSIPVIILSNVEDEPLVLQLIQNGTQDYLFKATCSGEVLGRALRFAFIRNHARRTVGNNPEPAKKKNTIGVLGSCGGVGVTTISSILAADLRHITEQSVLAVDLDLQHGALEFTLGAQSDCSLLDAISNIHRLDHELWDRIVAHRPGELDVLTSPAFRGKGDVDAEQVHLVLDKVQKYYDWTVIDLGRLDRLSAQALAWCSEVILVTSVGITSLYQTKQTLNAVAEFGFEPGQIRLIVNDRGEQCELSTKELKNMFGLEVFASLPPSGKILHQAYLQKRLPAVSSDFRMKLTAAARRIAGMPDEAQIIPGPIAFIANRLWAKSPKQAVNQ